MTGQLLATAFLPFWLAIWDKTQKQQINQLPCVEVPTKRRDLIDLDVSWPFRLYNDRDPLPRASTKAIYNQEVADN